VQRIYKALAICLLLTALVYGVLKMLGGVGIAGKADAKKSPRHSMSRHERGEDPSDPSERKMRMRARKLTEAEAKEFLKTTIIPEIDFDKILLSDALKILNVEIRKQTPHDQPRVRILLHPDYDDGPHPVYTNRGDHVMNPFMFKDFRLRKVPLDVLLKSICEITNNVYWFYKGDYYLSPIYNTGGISDYFYYSEKLSGVKLENIDASQLSKKWNEIIGDHDYFGPKTGVEIMMTKKAREALLSGELKLPSIHLNLENVTPREAMMKIVEHSEGVLVLNEPNLWYNPFNEVKNEDPFAAQGEHGSPDYILNEDALEPGYVPFQDPFE
jgi:hypothetical protein